MTLVYSILSKNADSAVVGIAPKNSRRARKSGDLWSV